MNHYPYTHQLDLIEDRLRKLLLEIHQKLMITELEGVPQVDSPNYHSFWNEMIRFEQELKSILKELAPIRNNLISQQQEQAIKGSKGPYQNLRKDQKKMIIKNIKNTHSSRIKGIEEVVGKINRLISASLPPDLIRKITNLLSSLGDTEKDISDAKIECHRLVKSVRQQADITSIQPVSSSTSTFLMSDVIMTIWIVILLIRNQLK